MQTTYRVERECHEGGGTCNKCSGKSVKTIVTQIGGLNLSTAQKVAFNWRYYSAKVVEESNESNKTSTSLDEVCQVCFAVAKSTASPTDADPYILQEQDGKFEYLQDVLIDGKKFKVIVKKV